MAGNPDTHGPDLAALLGAAIAILLTLTFGQGAWGPISTIVGLLILLMLFGYFWRQRPEDASHVTDWVALVGAAIVLIFMLAIHPGVAVRILVGILTAFFILFIWWVYGFTRKIELSKIVVGVAFSVVVGLVGAITVAQAYQERWFSEGAGHPNCISVALAQATADVRDLNDSSGADTLPGLVSNTLGGEPEQPVEMLKHSSDAVKNAFYEEYEGAIGDCLAGETFAQLWWVGVPFSLLTLAWWTLSRKKLPDEDSVPRRVRGLIRSPFREKTSGAP